MSDIDKAHAFLPGVELHGLEAEPKARNEKSQADQREPLAANAPEKEIPADAKNPIAKTLEENLFTAMQRDSDMEWKRTHEEQVVAGATSMPKAAFSPDGDEHHEVSKPSCISQLDNTGREIHQVATWSSSAGLGLSVSIMSFNINHGWNNQLGTAEHLKAIANDRMLPDFIFLQEDRATRTWDSYDEIISANTHCGLHNRILMRNDLSAKHGWCVLETGVRDLPTPGVSKRNFVWALVCPGLASDSGPANTILVVSTHLSGGKLEDSGFHRHPDLKKKQLKDIATFVAQKTMMQIRGETPEPTVIVGGDMNSYDEEEVEKRQQKYAEILGLDASTDSFKTFMNYQTVPSSIESRASVTTTEFSETVVLRRPASTGVAHSTMFGGVVDHFFVNRDIVDRGNVKVEIVPGGFALGGKRTILTSDHNPALLTIVI